MQVLRDLQDLIQPCKNWKIIRTEMSKAIENISETLALQECLITDEKNGRDTCFQDIENEDFGKGGIPFLGK